jgi:hypothetical protein
MGSLGMPSHWRIVALRAWLRELAQRQRLGERQERGRRDGEQRKPPRWPGGVGLRWHCVAAAHYRFSKAGHGAQRSAPVG